MSDEFTAVVAIDPTDGERKNFHDVHQCFEHVLLRLVAHPPVHRPSRADIGHRQDEAELLPPS